MHILNYPKLKSCSKFAKRWITTENSLFSDNILKHVVFKDLIFKQLETNFQSLRFTSGYMQDFGGQAMYMQQIFKIKDDLLLPAELENTPDVLAIENNPKLLQRFVEFLKQNDNLQKLKCDKNDKSEHTNNGNNIKRSRKQKNML